MLLTPATAELPLVPSCIPISSPPELKTSATLLQKGMDSSGATTTAITTTTRALPQDGTISFPSSEAGESENADDEDDDFLFSTDDEDEENGGTGSNVTTLIEGLGMGRAHGEQGNEEEEVELEEEDPDTRHARAVIAARALYAGIYSLSSFSSPCISRQELVEYDDGVAAYLGFEPMKLILNSASTPRAVKSPTLTRSPASTVRLVSAFTPVTVAATAPPSASSSTVGDSSSKDIVTPCSTPTVSHNVAYPLAPLRSGFLKLQ